MSCFHSAVCFSCNRCVESLSSMCKFVIWLVMLVSFTLMSECLQNCPDFSRHPPSGEGAWNPCEGSLWPHHTILCVCLVSVECVSLCAWAEMSALPLSVSGLVWWEVWCPVTEPSKPAVSPSRPRFGWCVPVWPVVGRAARSNAGAHAGGSRHLAQRHAG